MAPEQVEKYMVHFFFFLLQFSVEMSQITECKNKEKLTSSKIRDRYEINFRQRIWNTEVIVVER